MDELRRFARKTRSGRDRALDAFLQAGYPDVWRMCAALVDEQVAEDLAQETCLRAARAFHRFRGEASTRTWLLAIARHVCMDELRARDMRRRRDSRLLATELPEAAPDPSADMLVRELLSQLDPDRRVAFILTQIFRLSYEQAAEVCECPVGTIRSRVARARDQLIGSLEGQAQQRDRPQAREE